MINLKLNDLIALITFKSDTSDLNTLYEKAIDIYGDIPSSSSEEKIMALVVSNYLTDVVKEKGININIETNPDQDLLNIDKNNINIIDEDIELIYNSIKKITNNDYIKIKPLTTAERKEYIIKIQGITR